MKVKRLLNLAGDRLHALPLLVLYLTDGCNSRCITCDIWRSPRRNMSLDLVETIAAETHALQIRWVLLSGGEAMQHPEWPRIARRFREAGAHVMLLTNGLLLRKQADALADSVDEVIVSLDGGTPATYHAIRGVDAFDLVIDGIRAARACDLPVTTRTTVQRANYREIPQIIEAARGADVSRISFLAVDTSSAYAFGPRFVADPQLNLIQPQPQVASTNLSESEIVELGRVLDDVEATYASDFATGRIAESPAKLRRILVDYFQSLYTQSGFAAPRCNAPHFSTVIEVDGTLRPCYFLPSYGKLSPGEPLAPTLNTAAALGLRRAYRSAQRPECARCVCPLFKSPRALMEI